LAGEIPSILNISDICAVSSSPAVPWTFMPVYGELLFRVTVPPENSELYGEDGNYACSPFPLLMLNFLVIVLAALYSVLRSRTALALENLALRHQIGVLQRSGRNSRPIRKIRSRDSGGLQG
jgi:hypothetical protein